MPDGQVHNIDVAAEPGLSKTSVLKYLNGQPSPIPRAFQTTIRDSPTNLLQGSVRTMSVNLSRLQSPAVLLWKKTLQKETWLTGDIAFLIACLYTMGEAADCNMECRNFIGRLHSAYLVATIQSSLVTCMLKATYGFHVIDPNRPMSKTGGTSPKEHLRTAAMTVTTRAPQLSLRQSGIGIRL